jgi:hypothetical protein
MAQGRKQSLDAGQIERIKIALASGATTRDLAKRFSISRMTLIRHGLVPSKVVSAKERVRFCEKRTRKKKAKRTHAWRHFNFHA